MPKLTLSFEYGSWEQGTLDIHEEPLNLISNEIAVSESGFWYTIKYESKRRTSKKLTVAEVITPMRLEFVLHVLLVD